MSSNDYEQYFIPRNLAAPIRIGPFTVEEFAGMVGCLFLGLIGQFKFGPMAFALGFAGAIAWLVGMKMSKRRTGGFQLKNALYWYGPPIAGQGWIFIPPSWKREFWG